MLDIHSLGIFRFDSYANRCARSGSELHGKLHNIELPPPPPWQRATRVEGVDGGRGRDDLCYRLCIYNRTKGDKAGSPALALVRCVGQNEVGVSITIPPPLEQEGGVVPSPLLYPWHARHLSYHWNDL